MWITKDKDGLFLWTSRKPWWDKDHWSTKPEPPEPEDNWDAWNENYIEISPDACPRELEEGECIEVRLNPKYD